MLPAGCPPSPSLLISTRALAVASLYTGSRDKERLSSEWGRSGAIEIRSGSLFRLAVCVNVRGGSPMVDSVCELHTLLWIPQAAKFARNAILTAVFHLHVHVHVYALNRASLNGHSFSSVGPIIISESLERPFKWCVKKSLFPKMRNDDPFQIWDYQSVNGILLSFQKMLNLDHQNSRYRVGYSISKWREPTC